MTIAISGASPRLIVVKFGSSVVLDKHGHINAGRIENIASQLNQARLLGYSPVVVISGSVASGRNILGQTNTATQNTTVPTFAAVGQCVFMSHISETFSRHGIVPAQVLLTADDFGNHTHVRGIRRLFHEFAAAGVVPILNENDATSWGKPTVLGENDRLAALVAITLGVELLALLTSVPGVLVQDDAERPTTRVIDELSPLDQLPPTKASQRSGMGRGGIAAKLLAARVAALAGIDTVVGDGRSNDLIVRLCSGEHVGTLIRGLSTEARYPMNRIWAAIRSEPSGVITIDPGAVHAMRSGRSLLPVGITSVSGNFLAGSVVSIVTQQGDEIGRGRCNQSSRSLSGVIGLPRSEVLASLSECPDVKRGSKGGASVVAIHRDYALIFPEHAS